MFEAAEAVMRPEMVMGGWRHGSGGLEAVMPDGDVWWVSLLHGFAGRSISTAAPGVRLAERWVAHNRVIKSVNRPFLFVLRARDRDVPHQTPPQSPIHTSLAAFAGVTG